MHFYVYFNRYKLNEACVINVLPSLPLSPPLHSSPVLISREGCGCWALTRFLLPPSSSSPAPSSPSSPFSPLLRLLSSSVARRSASNNFQHPLGLICLARLLCKMGSREQIPSSAMRTSSARVSFMSTVIIKYQILNLEPTAWCKLMSILRITLTDLGFLQDLSETFIYLYIRK